MSPYTSTNAESPVRGTGDRVVVLAAGLVWLVMLAFPVTYAMSGTARGAELAAARAGLALLVEVYVPTVIRAARDGAPRPAPLALAVVAGVAITLPLLAGTAWFGGTVLLAALLGLSLPARPALIAVAGATGLATAQALLIDVSAPQAISIPMLTAVAGVLVVAVVRQTTLTRELAASRRNAELLAATAERLRWPASCTTRSSSTRSSRRWSWRARGPGSGPTTIWMALSG